MTREQFPAWVGQSVAKAFSQLCGFQPQASFCFLKFLKNSQIFKALQYSAGWISLFLVSIPFCGHLGFLLLSHFPLLHLLFDPMYYNLDQQGPDPGCGAQLLREINCSFSKGDIRLLPWLTLKKRERKNLSQMRSGSQQKSKQDQKKAIIYNIILR